MKPHQIARFAVPALLLVLASGCASMDPARVRREMQKFTDARQFDAARAVKAKPNPGGMTKSEEEKVKEQMIRDVVDPSEIRYRTGEDSRKVGEFVSARKYDDARDLLWAPLPSLVPAVRKPVVENRERLLHENVNRTQFIQTTNSMAKAVAAAVAKKDFAGARKAVDDVRPVRVYPKALAQSLDRVRQALVATGVPDEEAAKIVSGELLRVFEALFPDPLYRAKTVKAGELFKPDDRRYRAALDDFRKRLGEYGVAGSTADKICKVVDTLSSDLIRELWRPREDTEVAPPDAIGTTKLNELLWTARTNLLATVVVPAQLADLKARVASLLKAGKFAEARALLESAGADADEIAAEARTLREKVLVPAQVARRARELRDKVVPLVEAGKLAEARAEIHAFGVTGDTAVDDPVFAVKLGLLNARVNTAEWAARSEALSAAVEKALSAGDFKAASAAIAACRPVPAYGIAVDEALGDAAGAAVALGVPAPGADEVVATARGALYDTIAPRPDPVREARVMKAYLDEVAGVVSEKKAGDPDWSAVSNALVRASARLVEDDMSKPEADALMAGVLAGFKALLAGTAPDEGPAALTTEELNRRLESLKAELSAKVSAAVAAKLADEAKAKAEDMRKLALEMAERAAAAVDFDARINAFVEAVSDRTEPDLNRILADGARVLRLRRAGAKVSKGDATALLVAAVYMGFDDVANLALVLGADVDGHAAKDELARPPLLLALQYGFKGQAATVLGKADRAARDARGDGAVHYAVRGGNGAALVDLLRARVDAKAPGAGGATPIVLAADLGYAGLVQALVPFSDLEKADDEGFTALLRAAQNGRLDIVRALVAADAKLGAKTKEGDGALELAAKANAPDLLAWLLDERKVAPTDRVVSQLVVAGNVPTLQLMVAHGARPQDAHLAVAVKRGDFPMVKYLVNQGMDVNAEVVKAVCRTPREPGEGQNAGPNDGTYYGPDGESIAAFLREQGQRL